MISDAYQRGYCNRAKDICKTKNPYSEKKSAVKFYAWLAGWNDCDMGYELDLQQFQEPVKIAEKLLNKGKSYNEIQEKTGCGKWTIWRTSKRMGLSRSESQLKIKSGNLKFGE